MNIIQQLIKELEHEAQVTEKFLSKVPVDKFGWKPHPKSMDMKALATHIAELPAWIDLVIHTEHIDFAASPYVATPVSSNEDLINCLRASVAKSKASLEQMDEKVFDEMWTIKSGDQIFAVNNKFESIRHSYSQTSHHRAQLGVYFRLLDMEVPSSYGPSADEAF